MTIQPAIPKQMPAAQPELVRGIRRWDLVLLVVNSVIGAGIFGLPSKVFAITGVYSLLAFAACAAVVVLLVIVFAEVASRYTGTGGPYLYARDVFHPLVAFQIGWLLWLTRLTAFATIANLLVDYLTFFWPEARLPAWRATILTAVVAGLTLVNIIGVRQSALFSNVFTVGKLVPLALFIGVGLFFVSPQSYTWSAPPDYRSFSQAVLLLIYAFTGFEIPIIAAGEVNDPRRNFPFALLSGIGIVVIVYVLVQVVCIGTLPELANSERPVADAASAFLGSGGGAFITLGALVSMIGTLAVTLLAGSRVPFAMAEQGQLPRQLASTHPRFRTPHVSLLMSSVLILAIAISSSFVYAATLSAIARLFVYAATCVALLTLRRREDRPATFAAPGGPLVPLAALCLIAWLLSNVAWDKAAYAAGAVGVGLLVYLFCRQRAP